MLNVTGVCHCGQVQLSAVVNPAMVLVCHCTDCQVLTGSAFRVVSPALAGTLKVVGVAKEYAKRAESGAVRYHAFCPECATPLYARSEDPQGLVSLRVGVLAQRAQLVPTAQLWRRSAMPWTDRLTEVAACDQQELLGQ